MPVTQNINSFLLHAKKIIYFASGHNNIRHDIKYKKLIVLLFESGKVVGCQIAIQLGN